MKEEPSRRRGGTRRQERAGLTLARRAQLLLAVREAALVPLPAIAGSEEAAPGDSGLPAREVVAGAVGVAVARLGVVRLAAGLVVAVLGVGAAGAAIFLLVPNHLLVPSSKYRKAIAAVILVWSAKTRSFYPIKLALKAAGACAFLVALYVTAAPCDAPDAPGPCAAQHHRRLIALPRVQASLFL